MSWDPYLDLEHGVLRNRFAITDAETLARVESELTAVRIAELTQNPLPGRYDLALLQSLHWHIFSDIYSWAGQLRTVALGKGRHLFCPPDQLTVKGEAVFADLADGDYLRGRDRPAFVRGLTDVLSALTYLHPFREGNGRAQRLLLTQLAREAGYNLDWALLDPADNIAASRAAHEGDHKPLRRALDDLVGPAS
ncbi:Fic family protein [Pseudonocardia sp. KRD291]|uniref:Fic/DOC family protein n=1 Tax=Pseudonocardia sp. KRD291 TaxID=2792007 RepID=UPI001C4A2E33|nr:Fic family protein [Pseudonocardia sp. KRD291]MBW0106076.1 Fic family protein [Pseudonocardia sp. KRD291]